MAEPLDLADIKRHLVLDPDDTSDDGYLSSMIVAARRACEKRTRRTIVGEDRTLTLPMFPGSSTSALGWFGSASPAAAIGGSADLSLTGGSVAAVTISYRDGEGSLTVMDEAEYYASLDQMPALIRPVHAWPATQHRPDAVIIEYTLAPMEGDDLEMVRHAMRLLVGHWYANREAVSPDGRAGANELPMGVKWILHEMVCWEND